MVLNRELSSPDLLVAQNIAVGEKEISVSW
jgi:hypothetical protein